MPDGRSPIAPATLWLLLVFALSACGDATTCLDTLTDPLNCGACGHSCWGGTCQEGVCQPVAMGTGGGLVADDDYAAWFGDQHLYGRRLHSFLNAGDRAGDGILASQTDGFRMVMSGGRVYWAADAGIYGCSPEGCDDVLAPVLAAGDGESLREDAFTVEGGTLLWVKRLSDAEFEIRACAVSDCATTTALVLRVTHNNPGPRPWVLKSDGTWLVFSEGPTLSACRLDDCPGTHATLSEGMFFWSGYEGIVTYMKSIVALRAGRVFWHEAGGRGLMTCQLPDCTPTQFLPAGTLGLQDWLQVDDDYLYGVATDSNTLQAFPLAGGEPATLVTGTGPIGNFVVVRDFLVFAYGSVARVAR